MAKQETAVASIVKPTAEQTMELFAKLLNTIPLADDGDAEADMVARMLAGETLEEATAKLADDEVKNLLGKEFIIDSVVRRESDASNGGGQYVQCMVREFPGDGPQIRWSTGSTMCVAVIVRAYNEGRIPGLWVKHRQSDKATKAGTFPRNLTVIGQVDPILG